MAAASSPARPPIDRILFWLAGGEGMRGPPWALPGRAHRAQLVISERRSIGRAVGMRPMPCSQVLRRPPRHTRRADRLHAALGAGHTADIQRSRRPPRRVDGFHPLFSPLGWPPLRTSRPPPRAPRRLLGGAAAVAGAGMPAFKRARAGVRPVAGGPVGVCRSVGGAHADPCAGVVVARSAVVAAPGSSWSAPAPGVQAGRVAPLVGWTRDGGGGGASAGGPTLGRLRACSQWRRAAQMRWPPVGCPTAL